MPIQNIGIKFRSKVNTNNLQPTLTKLLLYLKRINFQSIKQSN